MTYWDSLFRNDNEKAHLSVRTTVLRDERDDTNTSTNTYPNKQEEVEQEQVNNKDNDDNNNNDKSDATRPITSTFTIRTSGE